MKKPIEIGENLAFVLIVLIIFLVCLIGGYLESKAQTVLLPTWVADSLIYEAKLSRQCSQVLTAQQEEIKALSIELVHTGTALKLSQSESSTLSNLVTNAKESNQILSKQFALDISKEKRKVKRWRRIGIIQAVVIIAIILTPSI